MTESTEHKTARVKRKEINRRRYLRRYARIAAKRRPGCASAAPEVTL